MNFLNQNNFTTFGTNDLPFQLLISSVAHDTFISSLIINEVHTLSHTQKPVNFNELKMIIIPWQKTHIFNVSQIMNFYIYLLLSFVYMHFLYRRLSPETFYIHVCKSALSGRKKQQLKPQLY